MYATSASIQAKHSGRMFHRSDDNKSQNQGTTKNSHIRHGAQTADITDVKEQNEVTLHAAQNTRLCSTIYPRNMVCFRYIIVNTLYIVA